MAVADKDTSLGVEGEYRICLIGRTGSGKSATGNNILGREAFCVKFGRSSVTQMCQLETAERFGKKLAVVDTPGLFGTEVSNEDINKEILKGIGMLPPGPHIFILVVQVGRFTPEDQDTVANFSSIFGEEFFRYLIVLFTRKDDLENSDITFEQYISEVSGELENTLQKCGNKCLAFDNKQRGQKNDKDVLKLIQVMEVVVDKNDRSYYSKDILEKVNEGRKGRVAWFFKNLLFSLIAGLCFALPAARNVLRTVWNKVGEFCGSLNLFS